MKAKQGDELAGKRVETLTREQWMEARAKADVVHIVARQPRAGGDCD